MSNQEKEPASSRPTQAERDVHGRFKPGTSGNPQGMAPGTKRRSTKVLEDALHERGAELISRAIEVALGDRGAPTLRALLPLLVPPLQPKGAVVDFHLPAIQTPSDAAKAASAVIAATAAGEIDVATAERILAMLATTVRLHETADLEKRIAALEARTEEEKS